MKDNPGIKRKYLAGTKQILDESTKEKEPYKVTILCRRFIVYPNVFSPKYFFDTEFFARNIKVKEGEDFLEIGCGTGSISILAALKGARRVVAVDINPSSVKNTRENVRLHGVQKVVKVYHGDVYSPLKSGEKFDVIFWNTPFGYVRSKKLSLLERAVFDPYYSAMKEFINGAEAHLKEGGRLLIGFSTTLGHFSVLKRLLDNAGFQMQLVSKVKSTEVHPVKFQLYEARPN